MKECSQVVVTSMVFPLKFRLAVGIHSNHSRRCPLHPLTQLVIWSWGWRVITCSTTVWLTLSLTWGLQPTLNLWLGHILILFISLPAIQFWLPRVCENEWVGTSLSQPHTMCSLWNCFSSLCTCTCVCMSIVDKILCTLGRVSRLHNATCTGQCLRLSALLAYMMA